jgi:hypothetical protein
LSIPNINSIFANIFQLHMDNLQSNDFGIQSVELDHDTIDSLFDADPNDLLPVTTPNTPSQSEPPAAPASSNEAPPVASKDDTNTNTGADDLFDSPPNSSSTTATEDEGTDDNAFALYTRELQDLGVFSSELDQLPSTPEEFKELWIEEHKRQLQSDLMSFLEDKHGEEGVKVFQDIFVKGVNPRQYLETYAEINDFSNLEQGWSADKIKKRVDKLKDYGDLEEEAKELQALLVEKKKEALEQKARLEEQKRTEQLQYEAQYMENVAKLLAEKAKNAQIDGIPLTTKTAKETTEYLTVKKWKLPNGELLTDFDKDLLDLRLPNNLELKVKLALLLRNKLDLSNIKSVQGTVTNKTGFSKLPKPSRKQSSNQSLDIDSFFDSL